MLLNNMSSGTEKEKSIVQLVNLIKIQGMHVRNTIEKVP
jgi:hypothetical protein